MKKKIVPIVIALLILMVVFIAVNHDHPVLDRTLRVVTEYLNNWLDIDWESIKRWMSA